MTTPDKEWIEKAAERLTGSLSFLGPDTDAWRDRIKQTLARELQSSYEQGVTQERERCAAELDEAAKRVSTDADRLRLKRRGNLANHEAALAAGLRGGARIIRALTPPPSEGEQP